KDIHFYNKVIPDVSNLANYD
ncbi:hypothetical protein, partial [Plasmodium yoelii yoelii]